jgi:predicted unusual protein kinase regulating ubiquinone biosynthesis (AarF/ABC1/UbiB family)
MLRGGSICLSFLYNYLLSDIDYSSECKNGDTTLKKQSQKLRCLSDTFSSYGGVLSKLSQMLCIEDTNNTIFSDCKPFSKEKTIKYFKDEIKNNSKFFKNIKDVNFDVFKSGSVGQVHKAKYTGEVGEVDEEGNEVGELDVIIKVRYVGLVEQTKKDLKILDTIISYLYYFADLKGAMIDIKTKVFEELDYEQEIKNHQLIYSLWKTSKYIEIPKIIPNLCTNTIICMNLINGRSLTEFIENSTQLEKNKLGECIIRFVFKNLYKHNIFYSDVHYGNFLVKDNNTLCVLDFGCIHKVLEPLASNLKKLHVSLRNKDKNSFEKIVENMGIAPDTISKKSKDYMYDYFLLQCEPWISEEFEFTMEWKDKIDEKNTMLMKEWILPREMVYYNKIPYGTYCILAKLKAKGKYNKIIESYIDI